MAAILQKEISSIKLHQQSWGKDENEKLKKVTQQYRVGDCKLWHSSITFSLAFLVTGCMMNAPRQVYRKTTARKT